MPGIEPHSRWEQYPRKGDLIRDLRNFFNHLEDSVDPAASSAALLDLDYGELPDATVKGVVGLGIFIYDASSVAPVDGTTVLDTGLPVGRWIKYTTGGGGPSTGYSLISWPFTFASPPLGTMVMLPAGSRVDGVTLEVTTAFDGPGAAVTVGTPAQPTLYFGPGQSSLALGGRNFHNRSVFTATVLSALVLGFTAAGSTVGQGRVHIRVQQP